MRIAIRALFVASVWYWASLQSPAGVVQADSCFWNCSQAFDSCVVACGVVTDPCYNDCLNAYYACNSLCDQWQCNYESFCIDNDGCQNYGYCTLTLEPHSCVNTYCCCPPW